MHQIGKSIKIQKKKLFLSSTGSWVEFDVLRKQLKKIRRTQMKPFTIVICDVFEN